MRFCIIGSTLIQIALEAEPSIPVHTNQDSAEVNDRGKYDDNWDDYVKFDQFRGIYLYVWYKAVQIETTFFDVLIS